MQSMLISFPREFVGGEICGGNKIEAESCPDFDIMNASRETFFPRSVIERASG
jgi:hypothetical protein